MPDINVNKLSEALNTKADIDLNNTGVFSTSSGGVNLVQSTPSDAKGREVASADFSLKQGGLELMDVGFAPLGIDESENKRRYLNGQVIIQSQFPAFTAAVKARMTTMANAFTTEENWQAEKTNSKLGQCGKFVVDDTAGTIRLPCVVNAQGLTDLALIGGIKSESLPNITGSLYNNQNTYQDTGVDGATASGAISVVTDSNQRMSSSNTPDYTNNILGWNFDASRSSSTYQDNAPVQQEAVQYPYYIQVATGVEETLPAIREYKTNVPYVFGDSKYFEANPYNASWLESNGQYNSSTVYPDLWSQLQVELNSSLNVGDTIEISGKTYVKRGLPVVLSSAAYADYDFVVNTTDQTFRLPLLNGEEDWVGNTSQVLSSSDIVKDSPFQWTATKNGFISSTCFREGVTQSVLAYINGQRIIFSGTATTTTTPRPGFWLKVKKGDVVIIAAENDTLTHVGITFIPAVGNGTLYYYVGDTVQDASLINAGAVLGQLSDKISRTAASDREMVVGWGIPDYTAGISFSNNTNYVAPKNGVAMCVVNLGDYQDLGETRIYINNNEVFYIAGTSAGSVRNLIYIPVSKGDIIKIYMKLTKTSSLKFYPFKGVN